jgi:hypothetical protein
LVRSTIAKTMIGEGAGQYIVWVHDDKFKADVGPPHLVTCAVTTANVKPAPQPQPPPTLHSPSQWVTQKPEAEAKLSHCTADPRVRKRAQPPPTS